MKNIIVIPCGINKENFQPSKQFKLVLDKALKISNDGDIIWIPPANNFKSDITEDEAAIKYIEKKISKKKIKYYNIKRNKNFYIDTFTQVSILKKFFLRKRMWPLPETILISYSFHTIRSGLILKFFNFNIQQVYKISPKKKIYDDLYLRQFYYNYKILHFFYELFAISIYRFKITYFK